MTTIRATVRSFVAIELPQAVQDHLADVQEQLAARMGESARAVRWTRPESIHLTLQFLGDVAVMRLQMVKMAVAQGCQQTQPFHLETGGLGVFPTLRRPRIIWIGLEGDDEAMDALTRLQTSVSSALTRIGYKPDKEFKPHLTLGRVRESARPGDLSAIAQAVSQAGRPKAVRFPVNAVSLMQSELRPGGSIYTRLSHVELAPTG